MNEPVAWTKKDTLIYLNNYQFGSITIQVQKAQDDEFNIPLYTHQEPQPMQILEDGRIVPVFKELTDEEIISEWVGCERNYYNFARAILRKAQE